MKRRLKSLAKRALHRGFEVGQKLGVDILPRHFYSEIPDLGEMKRSDVWKLPYSLAGVEGSDTAAQLAFVRQQLRPAVREQIERRDIHGDACSANGESGYGRIEAEFLYAFICSTRPRTIFQVGCGVSTAVCMLAAHDSGYEPQIVCVEPFPSAYLTSLARRGAIELIPEKIQYVDPKRLATLDGDLLFFVDSTHTLGPAGEVSRLILEWLPRLETGAYVHFHDITFPYDYQPDIIESGLTFWHESVLLHAFLAYNRRFSLRASFSLLHHRAPAEMKVLFPSYRPARFDEGISIGPGHFPSAAYIQVVG